MYSRHNEKRTKTLTERRMRCFLCPRQSGGSQWITVGCKQPRSPDPSVASWALTADPCRSALGKDKHCLLLSTDCMCVCFHERCITLAVALFPYLSNRHQRKNLLICKLHLVRTMPMKGWSSLSHILCLIHHPS